MGCASSQPDQVYDPHRKPYMNNGAYGAQVMPAYGAPHGQHFGQAQPAYGYGQPGAHGQQYGPPGAYGGPQYGQPGAYGAYGQPGAYGGQPGAYPEQQPVIIQQQPMYQQQQQGGSNMGAALAGGVVGFLVADALFD